MENREERREELREERREERREQRKEENRLPDMEAQELRVDGKKEHNHSTRRINKLWLWLGVLILIFILVWWLWTIGMAEDATGVSNGTVEPQQTANMILNFFR